MNSRILTLIALLVAISAFVAGVLLDRWLIAIVFGLLGWATILTAAIVGAIEKLRR